LKIRVIPSILTNGVSQVKGEKFNNWRTVGTVMQAVRVHAARDVDEIVLLDVTATKEKRLISPRMVEEVSRDLRVPLTVGGGIRSLDDVAELLAAGADKIVVGTGSFEEHDLIPELAKQFGSQAIVVAIDAVGDASNSVAIRSGTVELAVSPSEYATRASNHGAGELLVQNIFRDGTQRGMDHTLISDISRAVSIPVLASSGLSSPDDAVSAVRSGASAIVAGAILQFTQVTPRDIKQSISSAGFDVRR
jgi:cyclase